VIVFDVSTLIGVAIRHDSTPDRALRHALRTDRVAVSDAVLDELLDVLHRPRLARFVDPGLRTALLSQLLELGVRFTPTIQVTDCRDPKDDKYLELALTAEATMIVSSDDDLLVMHPWRGVRILRPAAYLADPGAGAPIGGNPL
jgi:putative PIN family toxin of toxin-antitoxin system